jgi:polar amino acid transport system substrate-binding protein
MVSRWLVIGCSVLLWLGPCQPILAAEPAALPVLKIVSLDWPPYTGANEPGQGSATVTLRRVFLRLGYQLDVEFMPWSRAMLEAKRPQSSYIGYFPEYPIDDPQVQLSASIGSSELRLIQHVDNHFAVNSVLDLLHHAFFVVKDYVNTPELDRLIAQRKLKPQLSLSDKNSIQKIAYKRGELAVIDAKVFQHLISHDTELLATVQGKVRLHPFVLGQQSLHVAFNKQHPSYPKLLQQLNAELSKLQPGRHE